MGEGCVVTPSPALETVYRVSTCHVCGTSIRSERRRGPATTICSDACRLRSRILAYAKAAHELAKGLDDPDLTDPETGRNAVEWHLRVAVAFLGALRSRHP